MLLFELFRTKFAVNAVMLFLFAGTDVSESDIVSGI